MQVTQVYLDLILNAVSLLCAWQQKQISQLISNLAKTSPQCEGPMRSRLHRDDAALSHCPLTSADSVATQSCPLIWFSPLGYVAGVSSAPGLEVPARGQSCSDNSMALQEWRRCQLPKQKLSMAMCWPKSRIKGIGNVYLLTLLIGVGSHVMETRVLQLFPLSMLNSFVCLRHFEQVLISSCVFQALVFCLAARDN